jgi:hypothetical protein
MMAKGRRTRASMRGLAKEGIVCVLRARRESGVPGDRFSSLG